MTNCKSHKLNSQLLNYTYNTISNFKNDGSDIREMNRKNAKVLMTVSINLLDDKVVDKLADFLAKLTGEETNAFAEFIKSGQVIQKNEVVQDILDKMSYIILKHRTDVPELKKMLYEYNLNTDAINDITRSLVGQKDPDLLREGIEKIRKCFNRNESLIEEVKRYSELKAARKKQQSQDVMESDKNHNTIQMITSPKALEDKPFPKINLNTHPSASKGVTVPIKNNVKPFYKSGLAAMVKGDGL